MTGCGDISGARKLVSVDVGSARVEITGDVSKFAGDVARQLDAILRGIRVPPIEVEGDFGRAVGQADTAAGDISSSFAAGADRSEDALAGVDEDFQEPRQAAAEASESIASNFEKAGSRAGAAISTFAVAAGTLLADVIKTVSGAVTDLGRSFIRGGWDRLAAIDRAEAKLRGLGHSASEVEAIMDDALASVRGTAFGLDAAAGVAARAVAAGVQPGEDLRRTLMAVADAAHIAGTGLDDVGEIISRVATRGRATLDEFNRLEDRGIPILSYLADQYGVTADAARDMVSRGEVDFETFRQLIEDNLGGAATDGATAVTAAWENVGFAFSRISANLQRGVFPQLVEVFEGIIDWLEPIEEAAGNVGDALGEAFRVLRETGSIKEALAAFRAELDPDLIGEATSAIRDLVTSGFQFLRDNAGDIAEMLINTFAAGRDAILGAISSIGERLPELIPQLVSALVGLVKNLVNTLKTNVPLFLNAAKDLIVGLADGIVNSKDIIFDAIADIIDSIADFIKDPKGLSAVVDAAVDIIEALVSGITELVTSGRLQLASLKIITGLVDAVHNLVPQIIFLGQEILLSLIDGILNALETKDEETGKTLIETIMEAIEREVPKLIDSGAKMLEKILEGFLDLMDRATETATRMIEVFSDKFGDAENVEKLTEAAVRVMQVITDALVDNIEMLTTFITETFIPTIERLLNENPELIDAGVDVLVAIMEGIARSQGLITQTFVTKVIPAMIAALVSANAQMTAAGGRLAGQILSGLWNTWRTKSAENLNRIKNAIINFFRNAGQWLVNAGSRIISGLIDGIRGRFDDVRNTLRILTSMLPSWKGPAELDRRILRDAGRQVMEGFQAGIQDERGNVERLLRTITSDIGSIGTFTGRVQGGDGAASFASGQPIVIENHIEIGGEVVRVVRTEINEHDRALDRRVTAGTGGFRL